MSDQRPYRSETPYRAESVRTDSPPMSTVSVPYDFPAARTMEMPVIAPATGRVRRANHSGVLGGSSLAFAVFTVLVEASGVELATRGQYQLATVLAIVAIAASVLAFVLGVLAISFGRGRGTGIAGAAVGLLADPLVLVAILRLVGGQ